VLLLKYVKEKISSEKGFFVWIRFSDEFKQFRAACVKSEENVINIPQNEENGEKRKGDR